MSAAAALLSEVSGDQAPPPVIATTTLETAKFYLRACLHWRSHVRWQRFLATPGAMRAAATARPQLRWKLQRDYLQAGLPLRDKLAWLIDHHTWAQQALPAPLLAAIYTDNGLTLATLALGDHPVRVVLSACERFAKEGEWVLSLRLGAERVAAVAFTVHAHGRDRCAHVGCLQGGDAAGTQDLVREATKALHGLRPKQAVMLALYGLMAALSVPTLLTVSNRSHVYQAHWRRRTRVRADYDQFWQELGGQAEGDAFRLPTQLTRKPIEAVASKHRAQARRRHQLEDGLLQALARTLGSDAAVLQVFPAG
ncbi:MAG: DUF535 family protein [Burkholderiales bacterium]